MNSFKPLLQMNGLTIIERTIHTFIEAAINDIIVVTGFRSDDIVQILGQYNLRIVHNCYYKSGMLSSIQKGVGYLGPDIDGFFVLPADIPFVNPKTLLNLCRHLGAGIVVPCFNGKRVHPPLISASLAESVVKWTGPGGMKSFMQEHKKITIELAVDDPGILQDIDTPEDFECLSSSIWGKLSGEDGQRMV
jgi:CTP:molybdopterin cytidylyltransferase MocA